MSLDSFNARALYLELKDRLLGSRLQKFSLLSADDVLLHLRSPGRTDKLILSVHPERSRFHLIGENHPQALVPNSFVMLGRKKIGGTRLTALEMPGLERRLSLSFHSGTSLVLDWSGRPSSLLLVDEGGFCRGTLAEALKIIVTSLKRFSTSQELAFRGEIYHRDSGNGTASTSGSPDGAKRGFGSTYSPNCRRVEISMRYPSTVPQFERTSTLVAPKKRGTSSSWPISWRTYNKDPRPYRS